MSFTQGRFEPRRLSGKELADRLRQKRRERDEVRKYTDGMPDFLLQGMSVDLRKPQQPSQILGPSNEAESFNRLLNQQMAVAAAKEPPLKLDDIVETESVKYVPFSNEELHRIHQCIYQIIFHLHISGLGNRRFPSNEELSKILDKIEEHWH